jgi:hypothetical protein
MTSLTTLADYEVFVYHRHVPPNIKRNRIPAPGLSFTRPNLTFLIEEIEREILSKPASG